MGFVIPSIQVKVFSNQTDTRIYVTIAVIFKIESYCRLYNAEVKNLHIVLY